MNSFPFGLSFFFRNNSFACVINIGTDKYFFNIFWTIWWNLPFPVFNVVKTFFVADIEDQNNTLCASEITIGYGFESFLASCVKNYKFDHFVIYFDYFLVRIDIIDIRLILTGLSKVF